MSTVNLGNQNVETFRLALHNVKHGMRRDSIERWNWTNSKESEK